MNEKISVKIVVFEHPEPQKWGKYCGYCVANGYFCSGIDTTDIIERIRTVLTFELQQRERFPWHLRKLCWNIDSNSVIPPIFADEELIQRTEESYCLKIKEPIIVELYVDLPKAIPCI